MTSDPKTLVQRLWDSYAVPRANGTLQAQWRH